MYNYQFSLEEKLYNTHVHKIGMVAKYFKVTGW